MALLLMLTVPACRCCTLRGCGFQAVGHMVCCKPAVSLMGWLRVVTASCCWVGNSCFGSGVDVACIIETADGRCVCAPSVALCPPVFLVTVIVTWSNWHGRHVWWVAGSSLIACM